MPAENFQGGPHVTAQSVLVGDVVHVRGGWRAVRAMRAYSGGDRLLLFEGGITYRLLRNASLRVRAQSEPAPSPVVWRAAPDPRRDAVIQQVMQCASCSEQSRPLTSAERLREWVTAHAGVHPAHRAYRHITVRPWHATPAVPPASR